MFNLVKNLKYILPSMQDSHLNVSYSLVLHKYAWLMPKFAQNLIKILHKNPKSTLFFEIWGFWGMGFLWFLWLAPPQMVANRNNFPRRGIIFNI